MSNRLNVILFALLILVSCGKDDPAEEEQKVYNFTSTLVHDGKTRSYRVHLPTAYYDGENSFPLVLALHGGGGSGEQFETQSGLSDKASSAGFIVVYPDGLPNPNVSARTWNAGKCCGQNASTLDTDDVGFLSKLIDRIATDYRVNQKMVYATGHSNGAMMSYRLANELSAKIAAIAPNAGNFQIEAPYAPTRNVPVLQVISKLDENVIYEGGMTNGPGGQYNPPIDSCLNVVAGLASCAQSKQLVQSTSLFTEYRWSGCNPDSYQVLLYLTEDGGHSWPGGNKGSAIADEPSKAFNNNDIIWDFFKNYSLP
jgi:polyhydroxybutyrate depolymerase